MKPFKTDRMNLFTDKWFVLAMVALVLFLYVLGLKPVRAVKYCHATAQSSAKATMQTRAQLNPENQDYQRAIQAGMFVDQDYVTFYRNCIRARGYEPQGI